MGQWSGFPHYSVVRALRVIRAARTVVLAATSSAASEDIQAAYLACRLAVSISRQASMATAERAQSGDDEKLDWFAAKVSRIDEVSRDLAARLPPGWFSRELADRILAERLRPLGF